MGGQENERVLLSGEKDWKKFTEDVCLQFTKSERKLKEGSRRSGRGLICMPGEEARSELCEDSVRACEAAITSSTVGSRLSAFARPLYF